MATTKRDDQIRILMWHPLRSGSTAFFRAIMNSSLTKVIMEPYSRAFFLGSERQSDRFEKEPPVEDASYTDIKHFLEMPYSEYGAVFSKNAACVVAGKIKQEFLPDGYQHTFLLRHPEEVFHSIYYHTCVNNSSGFQGFRPSEACYMNMKELHDYATITLGQPSVVIEFDDLCKDPERVLREYCSRVGLTFEESMLHWKDEDKHNPEFEEWMPWFEDLFRTRGFQSGPSKTRAKDFPELSDLPEVVHSTIKENIPYYEELVRHKIRFD